jgi:hypothetical protein
MLPPADHDIVGRLVWLLWAAVIAILSGLAKYITEHPVIKPIQLAGGLLGSALASFSFAALMIELFDISNLLVLAMAGPVGWLGGDILAALGKRYMRDAQLDPGTDKEKQ